MSVLVPGPGETDPRRLVDTIRQLAEGRSNAVGVVTLRANQVTTAVPAPTCGVGTNILMFPATANAAAALATTFILVANVTAGQFIISHANNAQVDKTFYWLAVG